MYFSASIILAALSAFSGIVKTSPINGSEHTTGDPGLAELDHGNLSASVGRRVDHVAGKCGEVKSPHVSRDLIARNPQPADDELLRKYEQDGRLIYNPWLFAATGPEADRLMITHFPNSLGTWQWQPQRYLHIWSQWTLQETTKSGTGDLEAWSSAVKALEIPGGIKVDNRLVPAWRARSQLYPKGPNVRFSIKQDKMWIARGKKQERLPTCAGYEAIYNVVDGIISMTQLLEPDDALAEFPDTDLPEDERPHITTWYEPVWYVWNILHPATKLHGKIIFDHDDTNPHGPLEAFPPHFQISTILKMRDRVNYVFFLPHTIHQPTTLRILSRCLASRNMHSPPSWPERARFQVGHWCFYALLASKPFDGVAWMFAINKKIGHKVLKSVSVFKGDDGHPAVLWTVADYAEHFEAEKLETERQWLKKHDREDHYGYPNVESVSVPTTPGEEAPSTPVAHAQGFPSLSVNSLAAVPVADDADLRRLVEKGRGTYVKWMLSGDNLIKETMAHDLGLEDPLDSGWQREWKDIAMWDNAWTLEDTTASLTTIEVASALGDLPVGVERPDKFWKAQRTAAHGVYPNGPNVRTKFVQDKLYSRRGSHVKSEAMTGAVYESVYNLVDGVIIAQQAYGPAFMAHYRSGRDVDHLPLPKPIHWNDMTMLPWINLRTVNDFRRFVNVGEGRDAFKQWLPAGTKTMAMNREMRGFLDYIVVQDITYPQVTAEVVRRCLASRGLHSAPAIDHKQIFHLGHWCYYALLATPNNLGIAWMLSQYRSDLGQRIPTEVAIYAIRKGNALSSWPTLVWFAWRHRSGRDTIYGL